MRTYRGRNIFELLRGLLIVLVIATVLYFVGGLFYNIGWWPIGAIMRVLAWGLAGWGILSTLWGIYRYLTAWRYKRPLSEIDKQFKSPEVTPYLFMLERKIKEEGGTRMGEVDASKQPSFDLRIAVGFLAYDPELCMEYGDFNMEGPIKARPLLAQKGISITFDTVKEGLLVKRKKSITTVEVKGVVRLLETIQLEPKPKKLEDMLRGYKVLEYKRGRWEADIKRIYK